MGDQGKIDRLLRCLARELVLRRHVYPGRVAARKMTEASAAEQVALIEEAIRTLAVLRGLARAYREGRFAPETTLDALLRELEEA
jgi:hypothetical protein